MLVIFALIRPALKSLVRPAGPAARVAERIDDPLQLPVPPTGADAPGPVRRDEILKIARDNPAAVAGVVRSWVGTNAKGA